jgi:hypothetical protein
VTITFNEIEIVPASCRISKRITWFARLPVDWIDWEDNLHYVGSYSLARTIHALDVFTCDDGIR